MIDQVKSLTSDQNVNLDGVIYFLQFRKEETQSVKRRLSETHEQEYLLLKEQLHNKELALETSQTSEEHMKAQVTQLIQENDSLGIELERLKEDLQQQ